MALKIDNIVEINGGLHIQLDQIKINERREIPLLNAAAEVVSKNALSSERLIEHESECQSLSYFTRMFLDYRGGKDGST